MSDYKITKISDNEYKVEKEIDWSSDDLEGFSRCIVCGKEFYPISKDHRCCSAGCFLKYEENKECYNKKEKSAARIGWFIFFGVLAYFIYYIVTH